MQQAEIIFPDHINGFSRVEYMSVFVALLYAFAVAEFFIGWSKMLRQRDTITFSADHIVFSVIYFWLLIINWFSLWPRIEFIDKGFLYFVVTIIPIMLTYVVAVFTFPDFDKTKDLKEYYDKHFNLMILFTAAFVTCNVVIGLALGEITLTSTTGMIRLVNSSMMIIVAVFNLKKLRRVALGMILLGLLMGSIKMAFV